ncbi:hypothetical protein KP509_35G061000 [Ceratopteris richardii]|nr:hypothetical protein KP509_35G061000 [Ceratopteris richardii]
MLREGLTPDAVTYTCALKSCSSIGALDKGKQIHEDVDALGLLANDPVLGTALIDMYAKCGALSKAQQVLAELPVKNVATWNALIAGYTQHDEGMQAVSCFEGMQREGVAPDVVTFICVLKACGSIQRVDKGERVHDEIAKRGLLQGNLQLANCLIDMYVKCGALAKAQKVLEELPYRNFVSWSSLIAGFVQQGEGEEALNCFERMQSEGISANAVTFLCLLKACGSIGAVDRGEKLHKEISKQELLQKDYVLGTALVDMYAKCGALTKAHQVLKELSYRDAAAWNALIAGSVQRGEAEKALDYFEEMQQEGLSPGSATFSSILSACSRLGRMEDAQMYFVNMSTKYGIEPILEHYTCMVDLFGRAGHLHKAVEMIEKIPSSDSGVWSALLSACRKWGDVNVGKWAFDHAVQVNKQASAIYVLMADIYAAAGMHDDAESIEALRIQNKAWKRHMRNSSIYAT